MLNSFLDREEWARFVWRRAELTLLHFRYIYFTSIGKSRIWRGTWKALSGDETVTLCRKLHRTRKEKYVHAFFYGTLHFPTCIYS